MGKKINLRRFLSMERDFKGVWIPKEIYLNKELSWSEKILLVEIDSLDNERGCFASNPYFAEFLGVSETRVSKMISKLKKLEYIRQESFNGRERILRSNIKIDLNKSSKQDKADLNKSSKQDSTKVQDRQEQKDKHNNIDNNLDNNTPNIQEVWNYYTEKLKAIGKTRKKTDNKTKHINARLTDNFTVEQLKQVIDNVFSNDFMLGNNDNKKMYIEIDNFMCNTEKVEKWLECAPKTIKVANGSNEFDFGGY
jgi:uncharacterized phage protein (TIGR02220 family)